MKSNNFDFLRQLAAILVIICHVPPLFRNTQELGYLGTDAVAMFFSISGFLVFGSWQRDQNLGRFFFKRALRIFPGLSAMIILTAIVIGPIFTNFSTYAYFNDPLLYKYIASIKLFPFVFMLPGVFISNPYHYVVDGSVWTLPMEITMYGLLALLGLLGLLAQKRAGFILCILLAFCVWLSFQGLRTTLATMDAHALARNATCFFSGMVIWHWQEKLPFLRWTFPVTAVLLLYFGNSPTGEYLVTFLLPFATISLGLASTPVLRSFGRFGDPSYGIYIWSFPVMQSLIAYWPEMTLNTFIFSSILISIGLGFASWHLVESRAIRLKVVFDRKTAACLPVG